MIPLRDEILGTCYAMIGMNCENFGVFLVLNCEGFGRMSKYCENFGILVYSSKFRGGRKDAVFT